MAINRGIEGTDAGAQSPAGARASAWEEVSSAQATLRENINFMKIGWDIVEERRVRIEAQNYAVKDDILEGLLAHSRLDAKRLLIVLRSLAGSIRTYRSAIETPTAAKAPQTDENMR